MRVPTASLLFVVAAIAVAPHARASDVVLVSVGIDGTSADGYSYNPVVSAGGRRVAFVSDAPDLVAGDTNGADDIFVRDLSANTTTRVSVASDGSQNAVPSGDDPAIAALGEVVAFTTRGALTPQGSNGSSQVYVRDLVLGTTKLVSRSLAGGPGNGNGSRPSLSADGRLVAFVSRASNLVAGDTNGEDDIFVHDTSTGVTELVSVAADGSQANWDSTDPSISADGTLVAFASVASNLTPGSSSGYQEIYVRDRLTASTVQLTKPTDAARHNVSSRPRISSDGTHVAFESWSADLVADDTNAQSDAFVVDRRTGEVTRVSTTPSGGQSDGWASWVSISADGAVVSFESDATDLVAGEADYDVFVKDLRTGAVVRPSSMPDGSPSDGGSYTGALSPDGLHAAFTSWAGDLVPGDDNDNDDVLLRELDMGAPGMAVPALGVSMLADKERVEPGTELIYSVTVANEGPPADHVVLTAHVPPGTTLAVSSDCTTEPRVDAEAVCVHPGFPVGPAPAGHEVVIELGPLDAGASAVFSYSVVLGDEASGTIDNHAHAQAVGGPVVDAPAVQTQVVGPGQGDPGRPPPGPPAGACGASTDVGAAGVGVWRSPGGTDGPLSSAVRDEVAPNDPTGASATMNCAVMSTLGL